MNCAKKDFADTAYEGDWGAVSAIGAAEREEAINTKKNKHTKNAAAPVLIEVIIFFIVVIVLVF